MIWQQNQISWDFKLTGNSNEKLRSKNEKVLLFENFVRNDTETNKAGPNGGLTRLQVGTMMVCGNELTEAR